MLQKDNNVQIFRLLNIKDYIAYKSLPNTQTLQWNTFMTLLIKA